MATQDKPRGRPLKFETVEELAVAINLYFDDCDKEYDTRKWKHGDETYEEGGWTYCSQCNQKKLYRGCILTEGEEKRKRPYTVTGLAVFLQTSRQTLLNYEVREDFFDTVAGAKQRIEAYAEELLFDPKAPTNGIKFSLSNNHAGWREKSDVGLSATDGAADLMTRVFKNVEDRSTIEVDAAQGTVKITGDPANIVARGTPTSS